MLRIMFMLIKSGEPFVSLFITSCILNLNVIGGGKKHNLWWLLRFSYTICAFRKNSEDFVVTHSNLGMWIGLGFDANANVG